MKTVTKICLSLALSFFLTLTLVSQENNTPVKGIIAGTSRNYEITFNTGKIIVGKITSIDKESIYIQTQNNKPIEYNLSEVVSVEETKKQFKGSFGLGLGIQYGTFGVSGEVFIHPNLSLNAGVGTAIFVTPIVNGGIKLYLRDPSYAWRPRLAAYYGTNAIIFYEGDSYLPDLSEKINNFSFSIGQAWLWGMNKNSGLDLDLVYVVNDLESRLNDLEKQGYDFNIKATGHFKISIGYRFYF